MDRAKQSQNLICMALVQPGLVGVPNLFFCTPNEKKFGIYLLSNVNGS